MRGESGLACPSRLEIARWEAAPTAVRRAETTAHVGDCARCSAVVADICESRALLLGSEPQESARRAAREIATRVEQRRRRRWLGLFFPAILVPAAAAILFVAMPERGVTSQSSSASLGQTGVKGSFIVEAYCKRGEEVFVVADGAEFLQGDRLRFAYTKDKPGSVLIFGVDDDGTVFPYYEDARLQGMDAQAGAKVMLPGSVELDSHHGWERIFALWSPAAVDEEKVRAAVTAGLHTAEGDIRRLRTLDLEGVEQVSFLLRRP